jgi:hypothetical protein
VSLAVDPTVAMRARRLLMAAQRRLAELEHPNGYKATHFGALLRREALDRIREALALLTAGSAP